MENTENTAVDAVSNETPAKKSIKPLIIAALCAILAIVIIIMIMTSKPVKIKKLEKFTATVEKEYTSYTNEDLDKAVAKYDKIIKKIDKCELNDKQSSKVNELRGECNGYFAQAKGRIILDEFNKALDAAGDEVKGVVKSMTDED
ncbi:MAG: hypothetical protein MJZ57_03610 [Bacteroidales bacterium]|nr:hypothetical protein [Bacteroidales bacterium]